METNGRPRALDETQENVLRVSIFVSRVIQVITQKEIATGYGISVPTLRRYYLLERMTRMIDGRPQELFDTVAVLFATSD
jgi:hypothetical protein